MPARSFSQIHSSRIRNFLLNSPVLVFLAGLLLWLFTYGRLDYTIGQSDLFWKSALIGVVLALLLFVLGPKEKPVPAKDRYVPLVLLVAGFAMLIPCAAGLINHRFAAEEIREQQGTVLHKRQGTGKDHSHYLDCSIGGVEAHFTVSQWLWNSVEPGGSVRVLTRDGVLGYDVVEEIRPADTGRHGSSP